MKKILVNYTGRTGGCALYAYEMTKAMVENDDIEVTAIISKQCENIQRWRELKLHRLYEIDTYTNRFTFIKNSVRFIFKDRYKIREDFKNVVFDAVYVPAAPIWTYFINRMLKKKKLIITSHDLIDHSGTSFIQKILTYPNQIDLRNADVIAVLTKKFIPYACNKYKKDLKQIVVAPQASLNYYNLNKIDMKPIYDNSKINFLFFGRIEKYKGLEVLIQAYKIIESKYCDVTLTIAGNGDFAPYLNDFLKLKNKVLVNRWIEDEEVSNFFNGKNIITVLPYLDATQSGVVNLAMAEESLVIASDCGGLDEQIEDGKTGIIVKTGDINALVKAMEFVINKKDSRMEIVKQASEYINNLSWNNSVKQVMKTV